MWSFEMPRPPNSSPNSAGPGSRASPGPGGPSSSRSRSRRDVRLCVERRVLVHLDDPDRVVRGGPPPTAYPPGRPSRSRPLLLFLNSTRSMAWLQVYAQALHPAPMPPSQAWLGRVDVDHLGPGCARWSTPQHDRRPGGLTRIGPVPARSWARPGPACPQPLRRRAQPVPVERGGVATALPFSQHTSLTPACAARRFQPVRVGHHPLGAVGPIPLPARRGRGSCRARRGRRRRGAPQAHRRGSRSPRSGLAPPASSRGPGCRRRRSSVPPALVLGHLLPHVVLGQLGRPLLRRRAFWASSIWSTSSNSSSASTSGERVGRQSTCSAPEPGYHLPSASRIPIQRGSRTGRRPRTRRSGRVYA